MRRIFVSIIIFTILRIFIRFLFNNAHSFKIQIYDTICVIYIDISFIVYLMRSLEIFSLNAVPILYRMLRSNAIRRVLFNVQFFYYLISNIITNFSIE